MKELLYWILRNTTCKLDILHFGRNENGIRTCNICEFEKKHWSYPPELNDSINSWQRD